MDTVENNLFKLILVGVLSMGALTVIPAKTYEKQVSVPVVIAQTEEKIPQVIIVGKRITKENHLLANR